MDDFKGLTIRFDIHAMRGQQAAKGKRTIICLGHTTKGWLFVPTTSSWSAPWQKPIQQTGDGWSGWDLRYRKPITWCPNMPIYLTETQVRLALKTDNRVGHAPASVIKHGLKEIRHAIEAGLMEVHAWFEQPGMATR